MVVSNSLVFVMKYILIRLEFVAYSNFIRRRGFVHILIRLDLDWGSDGMVSAVRIRCVFLLCLGWERLLRICINVWDHTSDVNIT